MLDKEKTKKDTLEERIAVKAQQVRDGERTPAVVGEDPFPGTSDLRKIEILDDLDIKQNPSQTITPQEASEMIRDGKVSANDTTKKVIAQSNQT